jgi:ribosomal-protein-alanine N-acetyltransferase
VGVPERVETRRLVLRRPVISDVAAIFSGWASDSAATRFMAWPTHRTPDDTLSFIQFSDREWRGTSGGPYVIQRVDSGELVGSCGFAFRTGSVAEAGCILSGDHRGCGLATEALLAQIEVARALAPLTLTASVHPANGRSIALLDRAGFTRADGSGPEVCFPNLDGSTVVEALKYRLLVGVWRPRSNKRCEQTMCRVGSSLCKDAPWAAYCGPKRSTQAAAGAPSSQTRD